MSCIKTGFHAFYEPHALWLYGDAYEFGSVFAFRICAISREPLNNMATKHFTIREDAHWFDEHLTSEAHNSLMICYSYNVTDHGYEGIPL